MGLQRQVPRPFTGHMVISPGRNYVFVHIPKTGGTSMALALEDRAMADDILIGDTPKAVRRRKRVKALQAPGRLWKHARLSDIDGMERVPTEPFVFTMVRNPWDRMVSLYHWARVQSFDDPMVAIAKTADFDGFLRAPHVIRAMRNDAATAYVTDRQGNLRCNAFIRLEHISTDLAPLEAHLGFRLSLPHVNPSEHAAPVDYYSAALKDHIGEVFAADIQRFGYTGPG
ncbi:MAG: sulfotransferase family 2 domain-containing protein [Paracoccaceae bacterium]|nr:sulfotransferase family 2 domain-containing protein [Paracoccaceae bacterium]